MRSRSDRTRATLAMLLMATLTITAQMSVRLVAQPVERSKEPAPGSREVAEALARVKADPNLVQESKIRVLRWRGESSTKPTPGWLRWLADLFLWLAQSARALIWVAAAVAAALLAVYISRVLQVRLGGRAGAAFLAPTHVQDLDIRPESLPDDIGSAARALWDRGERRAALALLYRGLLSRLAHVHRVPIRDSTTEGTCLQLAATHLTEERHAYVSRLVHVWQRSVYGGQDADDTAVYALCAGFQPSLDQAPAASPDGIQAAS